MTIAIIYHDADFDGKLSNEVCRFWLNRMEADAVVDSYGWDYGRPLPKNTTWEWWTAYDLIYIVDLSVDELMARRELYSKIVWIDHHKSAIEKWDALKDHDPDVTLRQPCPLPLRGYRIDGVAACRLCWQWFTDGGCLEDRLIPTKQQYIDRVVKEPELLRLAGEYDIWDHRDTNAKVLQFGLRSLTDAELSELIHSQFRGTEIGAMLLDDAIQAGKSIKSYCDKQNDEYALAHATTLNWHGLTWCVLNIGQRGDSDLLRAALKPEHDALFAWRHDGKQAYISLYHAPRKEHHDLSVIAKEMGGGGHKGACGFRETLTWVAREIYGEGK